jgi:transposase
MARPLIFASDPTRAEKMAARKEAFATAYAQTHCDALAARRIGVTVTTGEALLRELRREGKA